jgi:hypothetical protein
MCVLDTESMSCDDGEHLFEARDLLRRNAVIYKHAYEKRLFRCQYMPKLLCIYTIPLTWCSDTMPYRNQREKVRTIELEHIKHIDARDEHADWRILHYLPRSHRDQKYRERQEDPREQAPFVPTLTASTQTPMSLPAAARTASSRSPSPLRTICSHWAIVSERGCAAPGIALSGRSA